MNRKLAVALSGCAALTLTLAGCGDDNGEETRQWAEQVCDEVGPQAERMRAANESITEVSESDAPPEEVQEAYAAAYQELSDANAALASAVDDAGDPPVDDGAELREEAVAQLTQQSEAYAEVRETVDGLDTSDRGAFANGLRELVSGQLAELDEANSEALERLQSGELGQALSEQESCQGGVPAPDGDDAGEGEDGAEGGADDGGADDGGESPEGEGAEDGRGDGDGAEDGQAEDTEEDGEG